ncbi:uncharacterized protein LOC143026729 [Oratosquilla oratoria]|uniref:uncharacterized protein LOC143026729 n=1 Tax=Oratosquilla oratoria TaxID=337810 RepID=UPI003F76688D
MGLGEERRGDDSRRRPALSTTTTTQAGNYDCRSEGRFPLPKDCGSYVDCIPSVDDGTLMPRIGSCNDFAFHPELMACVPPYKVKGCTTRQARVLSHDNSLDYACKENDFEFICLDCKTLVNCVNGSAYPEPCGSQDFCSKKSSFGGAVCYPDQLSNCLCERPNDFKGDPYNEEAFLFCEEVESDPVIYRCPEGMVFDEEKKQCVNPTGLPPCSSIGVFANQDNCTEYYTCIFTTDGWVQKTFTCDNGSQPLLMYNEDDGVCEDPCTWETGEFECQEEGRFPNPRDCQRYFVCITDQDRLSGFRKEEHECPVGYEWEQRLNTGSGRCVKLGTGKSECTKVVASKCHIPDDLCQ